MYFPDTYISFRMQFDEELLPLEAELPDLGPGEGVDLGAGLEHQNTSMRHSQAQSHALVVLYKIKC